MTLRTRCHDDTGSWEDWIEADADLAEAIDFLEFYSLRRCVTTKPHRSFRFRESTNLLRYKPLASER